MRQSWSEWMVSRRLATVRHYETQGRSEEILPLQVVSADGWVVATPHGQVLVEELRSWASFFQRHIRSQGCRRRVAVQRKG